MNPSIEAAARNIIASMKRAYGAPYTRVPAREADFPHLDMAAYARVRAGLEAAGYDYLFDYAIKEINESPTSLRRPTMLPPGVANSQRAALAGVSQASNTRPAGWVKRRVTCKSRVAGVAAVVLGEVFIGLSLAGGAAGGVAGAVAGGRRV